MCLFVRALWRARYAENNKTKREQEMTTQKDDDQETTTDETERIVDTKERESSLFAEVAYSKGKGAPRVAW